MLVSLLVYVIVLGVAVKRNYPSRTCRERGWLSCDLRSPPTKTQRPPCCPGHYVFLSLLFLAVDYDPAVAAGPAAAAGAGAGPAVRQRPLVAALNQATNDKNKMAV